MYQGYEAFTDTNLDKLVIFYLVVALITDIYLYRGLSVLFNFIRNKKLKKPGIIFHWSFFALFMVHVIIYFARGGALTEVAGRNNYMYFLNTVFLLLYLPKLTFALALIMRDLLTVIRFIYSKLIRQKVQSTYLIRKYFLKIGFSLSIFSFCLILYGILIQKNNPVVKSHEFYIRGLPTDLDGLKLVQLSDLHLGSFSGTSYYENVFRQVNALSPDVLVITGDIINFGWEEVLPFEETFQLLDTSMIKLAVLGNHDFGDYIINWDSSSRRKSTDSLCRFMERAGFRVLRNEHISMGKAGNKLFFAGVDNWSPHHYIKYGKLDKALEFIPEEAPVVLLSHDPDHWEAGILQDTHNIALTLSGHTHGGQAGIRLGPINWSPIELKYTHWGGPLSREEKILYINTGVGVIGFLGRLGIRPEISLLTLKKDL